MGKLGGIVSAIYVILGLYIINISAKYFIIPELISRLDNALLLVSGILLVLGAYFFYKYNTSLS